MNPNAAARAVATPFPALAPLDSFNLALQEAVHPRAHANPTPKGPYNLVVVGAGTAGLVAAAGAAGLGAKVALVERELMGGDCLNVGCVPSKALIAAARRAAAVKGASDYGVSIGGPVSVDFGAVMQRMRRLRAGISHDDSVARFQGLGVDVYLGQGTFDGPRSLVVDGRRLEFSRALIATGARASAPPIAGLAEAGYLTNETVFSLTDLPARLAVIGGGPIGCELAQSFARFGSRVHLIELAERLLPREVPDAARLVSRALERDGVRIATGVRLQGIGRHGSAKRIGIARGEHVEELEVDAILVGVGRQPNVEGLGLEAAGVAFDPKVGVRVDDFLATSNPRIFAAGDICSAFKFTHSADALARIVIQNALFFGRARASKLIVPWCTYTDPEVAHVGLYAQDAEKQGRAIDTLRVDFGHVHRAVLEGDEGFLEVHVAKGRDRILGATVVGPHAGELISELSLAMTAGVGLGTIARTIHPYPTFAEAIKRVGDAYNRTRLTPRVAKILAWIARWRRGH